MTKMTRTVSARAISGHPTGVNVPQAQNANAANSRFLTTTRVQDQLATRQPNTDRRRFVTHT